MLFPLVLFGIFYLNKTLVVLQSISQGLFPRNSLGRFFRTKKFNETSVIYYDSNSFLWYGFCDILNHLENEKDLKKNLLAPLYWKLNTIFYLSAFKLCSKIFHYLFSHLSEMFPNLKQYVYQKFKKSIHDFESLLKAISVLRFEKYRFNVFYIRLIQYCFYLCFTKHLQSILLQ